jgi:signal transduction histidine kinase
METTTPLRVLHIEDSCEDSDLVQEILRSDGIPCDLKRIESRQELCDSLQKEEPYDLILAACRLPGFSGLHALELARTLKPEVPFVFVSGTIGEETAVESLRNGATDYILKDRLNRLAPAVRRALDDAKEKAASRELQLRLREASRLEALSTLSNGIAHDFNNVLTIILGHVSLLTLDYDKPERVLELTETIGNAARRAADVVQQLAAFARKSDSARVPVDLNTCVREALQQLRGSVPPSIKIVFNPAEPLDLVPADASQIERILMNLIANSIESMPSGGTIQLSTEVVSADALHHLTLAPNSTHFVLLKVADAGTGIDPTVREHIFEPFYTTKERGRGTGLGLPVVYGLIQAHDGWIDIDSKPGQGTTISLFFPTLPDHPAQTPSVMDSQPRGTETLLVIEDEEDVSYFLETILTSHGYEVLIAHEHEKALQLFAERQQDIRLVLSDIGLPKVDGITICGKLKCMKPELQIILCSGYASKDFKARMERLGIESFIAKPYRTTEILGTVRRVLDAAAAPVA